MVPVYLMLKKGIEEVLNLLSVVSEELEKLVLWPLCRYFVTNCQGAGWSGYVFFFLLLRWMTAPAELALHLCGGAVPSLDSWV